MLRVQILRLSPEIKDIKFNSQNQKENKILRNNLFQESHWRYSRSIHFRISTKIIVKLFSLYCNCFELFSCATEFFLKL